MLTSMSTSTRPLSIGSDSTPSGGALPWSKVPSPKVPGNDGRRRCVADLVLQVAKSAPQAIAVSAGTKELTFGELASQSMRLAGHLSALGAGPETLVGVYLERSFDFVVSAFAVLLAGAAYLPLDPKWPKTRFETILRNAQAPMVISRGSLAARVSGMARHTIDLDTASSALSRRDPLARPVAVTRENLAYVIYPTGSTGEPKGVEVTQGNLLNLIFWHRNAFGITSRDRASHMSRAGSDSSVWEIWPHLSAGATVVLVDEQASTTADLLHDWLVKERITIAFIPTLLAEPMLGRSWPAETSLRYLLTGGEALHRYPSTGLPFTVVNNYGPAECTAVATSGTIAAAHSELAPSSPPSIGKPIANTQIRILTSDGRPVAPGQVGEIYIAGSSVARGYRNSPQLTSERFLRNPFSVNPNSRMYRTGDLACLLPDGQIAFRGRRDN